MYILLSTFVKISIGLLLLRVATEKLYIWIIRVSLVVFTAWAMGIFFFDVFQCSPVEKQWDITLTTGHCAAPGAIVSAENGNFSGLIIFCGVTILAGAVFAIMSRQALTGGQWLKKV